MDAKKRKVRKLLARSGLRKRGRPGSAAPPTRRPPGKRRSGPGRRPRPQFPDSEFRRQHLAETRRKPLRILRRIGYQLEANRYAIAPQTMRHVMRLACLPGPDMKAAYIKALGRYIRSLPPIKPRG